MPWNALLGIASGATTRLATLVNTFELVLGQVAQPLEDAIGARALAGCTTGRLRWSIRGRIALLRSRLLLIDSS